MQCIAIVLMGVAGSGKSSVGRYVAAQLGATFIEGDEYHSLQNIQKMSAGVPLIELDRVAWIDALINAVNVNIAPTLIVACSALSFSVRSELARKIARPVRFIHLRASAPVLALRLTQRVDHYMKASMLKSQFDALESPDDAIQIDAEQPFEAVCVQVMDVIAQFQTHAAPSLESANRICSLRRAQSE